MMVISPAGNSPGFHITMTSRKRDASGKANSESDVSSNQRRQLRGCFVRGSWRSSREASSVSRDGSSSGLPDLSEPPGWIQGPRGATHHCWAPLSLPALCFPLNSRNVGTWVLGAVPHPAGSPQGLSCRGSLLTWEITRTPSSLPVLQVDDHKQFTASPLAMISTPVKSRQGFSLLLENTWEFPSKKCEVISRILVISWLSYKVLHKSVFWFLLALPGLIVSCQSVPWEMVFCRLHNIAAGKVLCFCMGLLLAWKKPTRNDFSGFSSRNPSYSLLLHYTIMQHVMLPSDGRQ